VISTGNESSFCMALAACREASDERVTRRILPIFSFLKFSKK